MGALGALVVWIVAEVVTCFIRITLEKTFGDKFVSIFQESRTKQLLKRIYNWIRLKTEMGLRHGIRSLYGLPSSENIENDLEGEAYLILERQEL